MTCQTIIFPFDFDLHITKYTFFYYLDPNYEKFHVLDQMVIIDDRKSMVHMTLNICIFDPLLNKIIQNK